MNPQAALENREGIVDIGVGVPGDLPLERCIDIICTQWRSATHSVNVCEQSLWAASNLGFSVFFNRSDGETLLVRGNDFSLSDKNFTDALGTPSCASGPGVLVPRPGGCLGCGHGMAKRYPDAPCC